MSLRLGRLPNDPDKPRLKLTVGGDALPTLPTPPAAVDYHTHVPTQTWGMDGNDNVGDCTCADVDHEVKALQIASGQPEVVSTADQCLAAYSAITGYNPADPNTDQGAVMQDVRDYWHKTGFTLGQTSDKILMFAELDIKHTDLIKLALSKLGAIGLGLNFPGSAMTQFDRNEPWDVVQGATIEGGHAVALVGYDASYWYVVTWGRVQKVTPAFFAKYFEEAWVSLSADFAAGLGTDAFDQAVYALGESFTELTGRPNPVPAPSNTPPPAPAPAPTPAPSPAPDAPFLDASPAVAARMAARAAKRGMSVSQYEEWYWRGQFGLPR